MEQITTNLKVLLLNAENLFLLSDQVLLDEHLNLNEGQWQKLSTSVYDNKNLLKTKALARVILDENPDLILFCEVGGIESLKNFNRLFLKDQYSAALIEGNSDRNIDVGFLVRKDLGFYFDLVTNKHRPINYLYPFERETAAQGVFPGVVSAPQSKKFSRDAAELHFFLSNRTNPFLVLVLSHLKSRLDPDGIDPQGFERRQAELRTLLEIYQELEARFQHKVPIALAGDFNGQASKTAPDVEFQEIYKTTQLEDVCELAGLPKDQRATYYQVGRGHKVDGRQLDYCFLSPELARYLKKDSVRIYRYKDHLGLPMDPPSTLDAKSLLPSDHYPIIFELTNLPVF